MRINKPLELPETNITDEIKAQNNFVTIYSIYSIRGYTL